MQQIWIERSDVEPLVPGLIARLMEAEAKLSANDIAGMTAIPNSLCAALQLGTFESAAPTALRL